MVSNDILLTGFGLVCCVASKSRIKQVQYVFFMDNEQLLSDVIESLRQDQLIESKKIVIFTASSNQKLFDEIKNAGIEEVFKKPFSLDKLTELIEKYRPNT